MKHRIPIAAFVLAFVVARHALADDRYIVVLKPSRTSSPNLTQLRAAGAQVYFSFPNQIIVTLPPALAGTLRQHPGVKYLQPVVTSLLFTQPNASSAAVIAPAKLALHPTPTDNPLNWDSGYYVYDGAGNISGLCTNSASGDCSESGVTWKATYQYDSLSRVKKSTIGSSSESYTFDVFGNMSNRGSAVIGIDSATNRLSDTTALPEKYDDDGGLRGDPTNVNNAHYEYDALSLMREKVSGSAHEFYVYTPDDQRIGIRDANLKWQWSVRDLQGNVLRQYTSDYTQSTADWLWVEDYTYRDALLLSGDRPVEEGGRRHFHLDHLGTPRLVTGYNAVQVSVHDYWPFGNEITSVRQELVAGFDREDPRKLTSHERDFNTANTVENSSYLDYMHARYGDPSQGRFLSPDKAGGDSKAPQTWNRYVYANNNPVRMVDPDGRVAVTFTGGSFPDGPGSPMYRLADALNGNSVIGAAKGFGNHDVPAALEFVLRERQKHPLQPVLIIGHSWGGDSAVELAQHLYREGVPVRYLVTLDVVRTYASNYSVPPNVAFAINYYTHDWPGDNRLSAVSPYNTDVENIFVNATHVDIDDALWRDLADAFLEYYGGHSDSHVQYDPPFFQHFSNVVGWPTVVFLEGVRIH